MSTRLGTEPCLIDKNFMTYFSYSTEDQEDKFPTALKFRTLPKYSLRSICQCFDQGKHLKCKATKKDLDTRKLGLSEMVAIFNIVLINDTKDDFPTEEMLNKPHISKAFY